MLNDFSFEELNVSEASLLKKSFMAFKRDLEENVFKQNTISFVSDYDEFESSRNHKKATISAGEGMLIAKVSHEMRTPLNGIMGFTDLLKEDELTEKQLQQVNAIASASHALMTIINELLEYTKLSAGLEKFEAIDFNFHSLIRDVMYLCNTLITEKGVQLKSNIDPDIPDVLVGDPSKLTQVLLNLIGNAIKFVKTGEIRLEVQLKKQNRDSFLLEFLIVDTGIGIAEEQLEHIFDSFQQAGQDSFANHGGYGLGLSIVKQIIEKSGGNIGVVSSLGIGTTFKFVLPYKKGESQKVVKINSKPKEGLIGQELIRGMRILVFEDNLLNQKLIEQRLKRWHCTTYVTDNAMYGLNLLRENKIDMVLMDLHMPGMNGFELTERIRSTENSDVKQIPVIALTADFTAETQEKCKACGIDDFILKPYSPEELLSKILINMDEKNRRAVSEMTAESTTFLCAEQKLKFDLSHMLDECGGEIELLEELVNLYTQNALEFIGNLKLCLQHKNFEALKFAAHKIKGGLAMMRTNELHIIVLEIHKLCDTDKNLEQLILLNDHFIEEYVITEKAMHMALEKIKNKEH